MALKEHQKKQLRGLGHKLHPVVIIGNAGLTAAVSAEIDAALAHHELIKVRVNAAERAERDAMIANLCERAGAETVQRVGHVVLIYRRRQGEPRIRLDA